MGRIGTTIKSWITALSGSSTNAQHATVEEFAGDERTVQLFGPCNEDFAMPLNCSSIDESIGVGSGYAVSFAYHNPQIEPEAIHGERRLYSTNEAGDTVMSEVFLKQDGTILIKNDIASTTMSPDGTVLTENANASTTINPNGTTNIIAGSSTINLLTGGVIEINGNADYLVAYNDLLLAFNTLKAEVNAFLALYNAHTHLENGSGSLTAATTSTAITAVADMTPAQVPTIKVP